MTNTGFSLWADSLEFYSARPTPERSSPFCQVRPRVSPKTSALGEKVSFYPHFLPEEVYLDLPIFMISPSKSLFSTRDLFLTLVL